MDLEQLEKLNELKEKGILTQEEFDIKKKEILNNKEVTASTKQMGVNWKNVAISFGITLGYFLVFIIYYGVIFSFNESKEVLDIAGIIYRLLTAVVFTILAIKFETKKYKNTVPAWAAFVGILFLREIAVWMISYQFLQIKNGSRELKTNQDSSKN